MTKPSGFSRATIYGYASQVLLAVAVLTTKLSAEECPTGKGLVRLTLENDSANLDSDRHYTHGMRLDVLERHRRVKEDSRSFAWIPLLGLSVDSDRRGLALGMSMFTPEVLQLPRIINNDRPYAGWLYGAFILERFGEQFGGVRARDHFELNLGIVGPGAFAKELQTAWHEVIDDVTPLGWDNQLKNEPALLITAERAYKFSTPREGTPFGADFIVNPGLGVGNVMTYVSAGALCRIGYNLPEDFGGKPATAQTSRPAWGIYAFTGAEGRLVAHNIFLDGNTFAKSHHVAKNVPVGDLKIGGALTIKGWELSAAYVLRTKEFKLQRGRDFYYSFVLQRSI